ncbi:MAG: glycosyltransferase family 2 protein [Bacteroidales bacterium]|nr:glycosyltransferase family 2 protein [Bacteroidales bacterium]
MIESTFILRTAVVILNWNGRHLLEKFLPSVEKFSTLPNVSIVVADNGSTDDSLSYLRLHHPDVQIIALDHNYGFAGGYNRALKQVDAQYYVLLNSDVEVTAGWLPPLLAMMQQKQGIAACMPKIKSETQRDFFEYAGAAGGFMDYLGYTFCRGRLFDTVEEDKGQYDAEKEIFWATGACCIVKASLFHEVGGFDENFFAHMEEIDLCWRWKNAGYAVWFTPKSTVYHVGGGMLPQNSPFKTFLNYRNNLLMMYKNLPQKTFRRMIFFRMLLDSVSACYGLLTGKNLLPSIWKAHGSYRKLQSNYKKIQRPKKYPSQVYHQSVVFQYFIQRKKKFENK